MRKLVFAAALLPLFVLSGCGTLGLVLSGSLNNPITPQRAFQLHAAFAGGVAVISARYASLPRCSVAPAPCADQKVINNLRVYVNSADSVLKKLDSWAAGNSALDGPAIYQAATIAIQAAQDYANANGVK